MSRAMRRHPISTAKPGKQQAMARPAMRPSRRPQREAHEGRGWRGWLYPRWAQDIVGELRKVTWPSREDTWNLTMVVIIVSAAFGVFLGGVDMFFNWVIDNTLLR